VNPILNVISSQYTITTGGSVTVTLQISAYNSTAAVFDPADILLTSCSQGTWHLNVSSVMATNIHTQVVTVGPFTQPGIFPFIVRYTNVYGDWTMTANVSLNVIADISNLTMKVVSYTNVTGTMTPYTNVSNPTVNNTQCGSFYVPRDMMWTANFSVATGTPTAFIVYADNTTTNYTLGNVTQGTGIYNMTGTLTLPPIDYIDDNFTTTLTVQAISFNRSIFSTLTNVYTVSPIWVNPILTVNLTPSYTIMTGASITVTLLMSAYNSTAVFDPADVLLTSCSQGSWYINISTVIVTQVHTQTISVGPFTVGGVFPITIRYTNVYGSWTVNTGQNLTVIPDISGLKMTVIAYDGFNSTSALLLPPSNITNNTCGLYVPLDVDWTVNVSVATGTPVQFMVYGTNGTLGANTTLANASGVAIMNMSAFITMPPISYIDNNYTTAILVQATSYSSSFSTLSNVYTISPIWVNPQINVTLSTYFAVAPATITAQLLMFAYNSSLPLSYADVLLSSCSQGTWYLNASVIMMMNLHTPNISIGPFTQQGVYPIVVRYTNVYGDWTVNTGLSLTIVQDLSVLTMSEVSYMGSNGSLTPFNATNSSSLACGLYVPRDVDWTVNISVATGVPLEFTVSAQNSTNVTIGYANGTAIHNMSAQVVLPPIDYIYNNYTTTLTVQATSYSSLFSTLANVYVISPIWVNPQINATLSPSMIVTGENTTVTLLISATNSSLSTLDLADISFTSCSMGVWSVNLIAEVITNLHTPTVSIGPFNTAGYYPVIVRYTNVYGDWTINTGLNLSVQVDLKNISIVPLTYNASNGTLTALPANDPVCGVRIPRDTAFTLMLELLQGTPLTWLMDINGQNTTIGNPSASGNVTFTYTSLNITPTLTDTIGVTGNPANPVFFNTPTLIEPVHALLTIPVFNVSVPAVEALFPAGPPFYVPVGATTYFDFFSTPPLTAVDLDTSKCDMLLLVHTLTACALANLSLVFDNVYTSIGIGNYSNNISLTFAVAGNYTPAIHYSNILTSVYQNMTSQVGAMLINILQILLTQLTAIPNLSNVTLSTGWYESALNGTNLTLPIMSSMCGQIIAWDAWNGFNVWLQTGQKSII
jgi:hypothetical protein